MRKEFLPVALTVVLAALLAGCGKPVAASSIPKSEQTFNVAQYNQDFASASPDIQTLSNRAWRLVQSGAFQDALKCLGQLSAKPELNDAQKKSVADLTGQIQKELARHAAAQ